MTVITDVFPAKMLAQCFAIEDLVTVVVLVLESKVYSTVISVSICSSCYEVYISMTIISITRYFELSGYLEVTAAWRGFASVSHCNFPLDILNPRYL